MANNSWLPALNTVVVDGLLHIVGKVCGCFNSCTSICVRLLRTCKHSQASTAGLPGMTNCMYNATMHLRRGSYTADLCWLCVHTSAKQPCPLSVCVQAKFRKCGIIYSHLCRPTDSIPLFRKFVKHIYLEWPYLYSISQLPIL